MSPRRRSELFRFAVGVIAIAIAAAGATRLAFEPADWWLIASLAVTAVLALEFPLHVNLNTKVSVASAVFFAAVMLLPLWQAPLLVGVLQAADICIAAARRVRRRSIDSWTAPTCRGRGSGRAARFPKAKDGIQSLACRGMRPPRTHGGPLASR